MISIGPMCRHGRAPRGARFVSEARHRAGGFTLIELVTVLVLLGILAAVAIPRLGDVGAFEARGYYDELVSAARYGQKLAHATGCPITLTVSGSNYRLEMPNSVASCPGGPFTLTTVGKSGNPADPYDRNAPGGISISPAATVVFAPSGSATAATFTVSGGGFSRSFQVHGATGYVEAPN